MHSLSINVAGELDDVSMVVTLQSPTIYFCTTIFVSDNDIKEQSAIFSEAASTFYEMLDETSHKIYFGPKLERSPSCAISLKTLSGGNFLVCIELIHIVTGSSYSAVDKCTGHFVTDVASLDAFTSELRSITSKLTSQANLHGFC